MLMLLAQGLSWKLASAILGRMMDFTFVEESVVLCITQPYSQYAAICHVGQDRGCHRHRGPDLNPHLRSCGMVDQLPTELHNSVNPNVDAIKGH